MKKSYEKPVIRKCAKLENVTSLGRGGPVVVSGISFKPKPTFD